jgi:GTP-binding protein HflX
LEELEESGMSRMGSEDVVFMSAAKKIHVEEFREILYNRSREIHIVRFPYNDFLFEDFSE